jgi:hypothetical protein
MLACNFGDAPARIDCGNAVVALCTNRKRDSERVAGSLTLNPKEGVVLLRQ